MIDELALRIQESKIYQDYLHAFEETTGLPLEFRPHRSEGLAGRASRFQNPFCSLLARDDRGCALCIENQQRLVRSGDDPVRTSVCLAGLYDSAIPVHLGDELVGFLHTGQVALSKPDAARFKRVARRLLEWGVTTDLKRLEEAYFHSHLLTPAQYEATLRLLAVFAQHLSLAAEQIAVAGAEIDPPAVRRAKRFIDSNDSRTLRLGEVARAVNMSAFHFCRLFRKATGFTFTRYLSMVRIAKAKNLLLNPNLNVSEIAYQVGFNSLTHFNRVFRALTGQSPTRWRAAARQG